jgi:hypothetical protein
MNTHRLLAAAAAVSALSLGACATVPPAPAPVAPPPVASIPPAVPVGPLAPVVHDTDGLEKLAVVRMNPATASSTPRSGRW